jgi:molybdopterin-containing oxidoreductase family iron-sulfur binding subunit
MKDTGKTYWRSLDELAAKPEFDEWLHREFPQGASELRGKASRRNLLKLMAASFGLAGLTACRRPVENILPVSRAVEDYIPGAPLYYATAMTLGGVATGLVVECHDGRPTKIEGNPRHPESLGACSAFAQASVLNLYDPDRSRTVLRERRASSWEEFTAFAAPHFDALRTQGGQGLRFLSEMVASPSLDALRRQTLAAFPQAKWIEYEPLASGAAHAGAELAFGEALDAHAHYGEADVIVSLDHDFLGLDAPSILPIREFTARRRVDTTKDQMNRLYVVESQYSLTGAAADHRLRARSSDVREVAVALAEELKLIGNPLKVLGPPTDNRAKWIRAVARDLDRHRGGSLVVAGPRQPALVHALALWINHALGNVGRAVTLTRPVRDRAASFGELAAELSAGRVNTLVVLGGNPAYTAPADLDLAAGIARVPVSIHLGEQANETAAAAKWHLPEAHYLETWGDARASDGTLTIAQPMIQPLHGGRSALEVLALLGGRQDARAYDIVREHWTGQWPAAERERRWRQALHDGRLESGARAEVAAPKLDAKRITAAIAAAPSRRDALEVVFVPSSSVYDGRFANNGWMQEAPDPMTKLTWDNAALVSPATARQLGVEHGDVVALARQGREVAAPVYVQPGQADGSISIALGYGRDKAGRVGRGVGTNAYHIRTSDAVWFAGDVAVRKLGRKHAFAVTQEHSSMEGRPQVREASVDEYRQDPHFASAPDSHTELFSLYKETKSEGHYQWGMAIDLNSCIGCNACLVACQAENNIPIVGKREVIHGREMHWIRMDRYFAGAAEDPQVLYQPMACQQCESAPCENVCPVAATNHSSEGLNDMVYNRCIGTRYCANNCPYKVRRFNFFDYHKAEGETLKAAYNPDVTVRMRGVMEKCTYCVQRIQEKKIQAKTEGRRGIADGEIVTACQQTCPAGAIVFGNINDPSSRVSKLKREERNYAVLKELNTKPRTTYLAKLRNPNPELV